MKRRERAARFKLLSGSRLAYRRAPVGKSEPTYLTTDLIFVPVKLHTYFKERSFFFDVKLRKELNFVVGPLFFVAVQNFLALFVIDGIFFGDLCVPGGIR